MERQARLIRNGVVIPATLTGDGKHNDVVEVGSVTLTRGPSGDSEHVFVDASKSVLAAVGEPLGGYRQIRVEHDGVIETLYQAIS